MTAHKLKKSVLMMKPMIYKYTRFSTEEQGTGDSKRRQDMHTNRLTIELAKSTGLPISKMELHDSGKSAFHHTHVKKGMLGKFLLAQEKGEIAVGSYLVVENIDRLTRASMIDAYDLIFGIIKKGVTICTAMDGQSYDPEKLNGSAGVMLTMNVQRANYESQYKSDRVNDQLINLCEKWVKGERGFTIGGTRGRAWVKWDAKKREFVPNEKWNGVLLALKMYKKGWGGTKILNEVHARFPLANFPETIQWFSKTIKDESLTGVRLYNVKGVEYRLEGYYPAMISKDEHDALLHIVKDRGRSLGESKVFTIINKQTNSVCGHCGRAMRAQNNVGRIENGDLIDSAMRTTCTGKTRGRNNCHSKVISTKKLEAVITWYCQNELNKSSLATSATVKQLNKDIDAAKGDLESYQMQVTRITNLKLDKELADIPMIEEIAQLNLRLASFRDQELSTMTALNEFVAKRDAIAGMNEETMLERWENITSDLKATETKKRMKLQKVFIDTFSEIKIWTRGYAGDEKHTSIRLTFHNGVAHEILFMPRTGKIVGHSELK